MKIIFAPNVRIYLKELSEILYEKEYFGFEEDAFEYVENLITDVLYLLPNKPKRIAPAHFAKYGNNLRYAIFKKNDNTQWYVFFNFEDDVYLIRYIGNNHTCAQYL